MLAKLMYYCLSPNGRRESGFKITKHFFEFLIRDLMLSVVHFANEQ